MSSIESRLGYNFKSAEILERALTHKSYQYEKRDRHVENNEKLEFLGDSVLSVVLSEFIMERFPKDLEGDLSKKRACLVNEESLALIAQGLGISDLLLLGKGEQLSGGSQKPRILASALEALLGAIYLDGGFSAVRPVIRQLFESIITLLESDDEFMLDYKTRVQEVIQQEKSPAPIYKVAKEDGPAHQKLFEVELLIQNEVYSTGIGRSKKRAEQNAAQNALDLLGRQGRLS